MKVNEIFYSIQGEGRNIGLPSWFIRTSGCNLDCGWCDTKYAKKGKNMTIKQILGQLDVAKCDNVVLTGGEPLIQKDIKNLCDELFHSGYNTEIETNGTIYNPDLIGFAQFVVSPKLGSSGHEPLSDILEKYNGKCQFKFVVKNNYDFMEVKDLTEFLGLINIILMPEGVKFDKGKLKWLVERTKRDMPHAQVIPRLQVLLYGKRRGI